MKKRLFAPGPTMVPPEVLAAMAEPFPHHRTPEFSEVFGSVCERLSPWVGSKDPSILLAASGTGGMEASVVNLVAPGEKALFVGGGKFAERWGLIMAGYGIEPVEVKVPWGEAVDPAEVGRLLAEDKSIRAAYVTYSETSTGTLHDLPALAAEVEKARKAGSEALLVADCITAWGAHEIHLEKWGVDAVVGGSQKAFMMPPGLSSLNLSARAWERVESLKGARYYFDLRLAKKSLAKKTSPFTPAITMVYALSRALDLMEEEGMAEVFARHARMANAMQAAVKAMGLTLFPKRPSNIVTVVDVPESIDGAAVKKRLLDKHGARVADGQDHVKGKIWRLGHIGYYDELDMVGLLTAFEESLIANGWEMEPGAGLAAYQRALLGTGQPAGAAS